jgi:hypothetical protein
MKVSSLLLTREDVQQALGPAVSIAQSKAHKAVDTIGSVVAVAARDAGYRSFSGHLTVNGAQRPLAVGQMALLFDQVPVAVRTFTQVAQAAHLRTRVGAADAAVETVTASTGLVSYWGYLHCQEAIIVLTLDTVDPQEVSMSTFRSLVIRAAERLEQQAA